MSKKEGYSVEGLFGTIKHYDSKGHKIGESVPSMWGGYNNYDSKGHKIGETRPSFLGYNTYDNKGHKTGSSMQGFLGTNHYDAKGHKVGTTMQGFIGSNTYGNGTNPDVVNQASAAAAMRHDATAMAIGAIASQSNDMRRDTASYTSSTIVPHPTVKVMEANIQYIITRLPGAKQNRYYLCDSEVSIGDRVTVPDCGISVQVLAVVTCDPSAAPFAVDTTMKVLRVLK